MMYSRKKANFLNERISLVCLVFLWISPVVFATESGADLIKDGDEKFLRVKRHIRKTRQLLQDVGKHRQDDELRRDAVEQSTTNRMADDVRVLENVTSTLSEILPSMLSSPSKRELCSASRLNFTVCDRQNTAVYRTYDGACNNVLNVNWGKALTPFVRQLPAVYADASGSVRLAESGNALPPPRIVGMSTLNDADKEEQSWTVLSMHFGQFVTHDVVFTEKENGNCTSCETTRQCLPIMIPSNDPFFTASCFKFVRSLAVPDVDCNMSPRQQLNKITSFLDLSQVYGNSEDEAKALRNVNTGKGLLLSLSDPHSEGGLELLPNDDESEDCIIANPQLKCGRTGDIRAATQTGLAALHTVLLRQHNRMAEKLAKLNPDWNDEKLYQEARAVCIAMWQHIIYNEYLPPLMGSKNMARHDLKIYPASNLFEYDPLVNPSSTNVFAAAAYRMGHSQVPNTLLKLDRNYTEIGNVKMERAVFNASHFVTSNGRGGIGAFVRGMFVQELPAIDLSFTDPVSKKLFADPNDGHSQGVDLAVINIQRGRDHGIADYNAWRKYCKLPEAGSFDDLLEVMSEATVSAFRNTYKSVNDIDLYPALLGETPESGQLMGPTLMCLIGEQFHNLKFGDRFWYENGLGEQAFTKAQLREIRKTTMARILCDTNDIPTIQPYVFRVPDTGTPPYNAATSFYTYSRENSFPDENGDMPGFFNGRVPCQGDDNVPELNLTPWTEGYVDDTEDAGLVTAIGDK